MADFSLEQEEQARARSNLVIAGVDEVGRGPWAGPVVAAAIIPLDTFDGDGIVDSKKLSAQKRESLAERIKAQAHVSIASASVAEIDDLNILQATFMAMRRAVDGLPAMPDLALVDGNKSPDLPCRVRTVIKGDQISLSIAAASIVAKVERDKLMTDLAGTYGGYGWERNKGYGTPEHRAGLESHGVTPHHRRSFAPIHKMLCEDSSLTY